MEHLTTERPPTTVTTAVQAPLPEAIQPSTEPARPSAAASTAIKPAAAPAPEGEVVVGQPTAQQQPGKTGAPTRGLSSPTGTGGSGILANFASTGFGR